MAIYTNKIKTHRGIGLIEILIATVVVAVGLMSVGSLQSNLMSSSGESKTRTEAIKLAEAKLEGLRNNIIKTSTDPSKSSFDVDLAQTTTANDPPITGSNATFSRSWSITDATAPNRKNISVKVTWAEASASNAEKAEKTVNMVSELVWADPGKATDYATGGNGMSGKAHSPNNNSSETSGTQFDRDQITGETALNDGSNLLKYDDGKGHIYLLDLNGKALIKFNGGVIHTIKGNVYNNAVEEPLSTPTDYTVTFSDLAHCVFPVTIGKSDYICYFGGDCSNDGSGCSSTTSTAVSGGWYGKVGLIEKTSNYFHNKKVCFAEDIASEVALTAATTARFYSTQRLDANNVVVSSEGINQSFACQDFLVVESTGKKNDCHLFQNSSVLSVPSSAVQRTLVEPKTSNPNVSLAENVSSCGTTVTYTISGGISGDQANLVSVFVNGNSCPSTVVNNAYSYSCAITTVNTTSSLTITATGGNVTPDSTVLPVSTSQTSITGPTLVANTLTPVTTNYHITGTISGNLASSVVLSLSGGICTKPSNNSYDCAITSTPTTVTINASGGNVTPSNATVSLADVANVSGPNFVAASSTSLIYIITGHITGSQAASVTLSMNNNNGVCLNLLGNYTCTTILLPPGTVTINATGGNVSPSSASVTLAGVINITGGPSFNADNLASCNVTVTGNISQGILAKSPGNGAVKVRFSKSSPSGTGSCDKIKVGLIYTYSCNVGSVNNSGQVTISGDNVTVNILDILGPPNPVPVSCTGNSLILTGPNLITTN